LDLQEFVQQQTAAQAAEPSFRFRYPVTDVFFFVEKKPLRRQAPGAWDASANSFTPETGMVPLKRAGVEYQATNILAAYAATHGDLRPMYEDDDMTVYHVAGPSVSPRTDTAATN